MTGDLFAAAGLLPRRLELARGAVLLCGFAARQGTALWDAVQAVASQAPFRHMTTRGGFRMSVAMTNCGTVGWVSDRRGYRYQAEDPVTGCPWPAMPEAMRTLAQRAAAEAGFPGFEPDARLINRYAPGVRLALHQDKDERDFSAPIVSVSLGLPATFLFGTESRGSRPMRVPLEHGDVVVWGGAARMAFHGVAPLAQGVHPLCGDCRINLTFRKAL